MALWKTLILNKSNSGKFEKLNMSSEVEMLSSEQLVSVNMQVFA